MKTDSRILWCGAILSLLAAFDVIVLKQETYGNVIFMVSNVLLYWYAISAVWEFCRNLLETPENPPTQ